jgi:hypothetical protein
LNAGGPTWLQVVPPGTDLEILGKGYFCGKPSEEGRWTRDSLAQPTQLWGGDGREVLLNAGGPTWLQVVPPGTDLEIQ